MLCVSDCVYVSNLFVSVMCLLRQINTKGIMAATKLEPYE